MRDINAPKGFTALDAWEIQLGHQYSTTLRYVGIADATKPMVAGLDAPTVKIG